MTPEKLIGKLEKGLRDLVDTGAGQGLAYITLTTIMRHKGRKLMGKIRRYRQEHDELDWGESDG